MPTLTNSAFWVRFSLYNLLVVALLGLLMRYKIGFNFPFFDQKNLQHAHSHFAFAGWVSQTLMVLMVKALNPLPQRLIRYTQLLTLHLVLAYGMLFSFSIQGYGIISIFFSTASLLLHFYFAGCFSIDLKKVNSVYQPHWFIAALMANILSSAGTVALSYMLATKHLPQHLYLSSVYWYLHFQYNGWFFFACAGLYVHYLFKQFQVQIPTGVFWLFAASCAPAFGLSILWMKLPNSLYWLIAAAAAAQFCAWLIMLQYLLKAAKIAWKSYGKLGRVMLLAVAVAITIKLSLQLASIIPEVSKLAFGFRPIVIAYLHLVLLAIITLFLITYLFLERLINNAPLTKAGLIVFATGIFLNEAALGVQGIAALSYTLIPYINQILFGIAGLIVVGLILLIVGTRKPGHNLTFNYDSAHN